MQWLHGTGTTSGAVQRCIRSAEIQPDTDPWGAARLTATFKGIEVLHDLVPPDPHTLQLVINLRDLLADVHALLGRYRPLMVASVKVADVPLLQEAIKRRYEQVLAGEPPDLFL